MTAAQSARPAGAGIYLHGEDVGAPPRENFQFRTLKSVAPPHLRVVRRPRPAVPNGASHGIGYILGGYLPSRFECVACQLKIAGLSQLTACGLGATYKSTSTYDAAEYYAPEDDYRGYDDDNNEP